MNTRELIQWTAGMAAASLLVYMSYLSMQEGFDLSLPVITGMLGLIILLLYGKDPLIRFLSVWRGTHYRPRHDDDGYNRDRDYGPHEHDRDYNPTDPDHDRDDPRFGTRRRR